MEFARKAHEHLRQEQDILDFAIKMHNEYSDTASLIAKQQAEISYLQKAAVFYADEIVRQELEITTYRKLDNEATDKEMIERCRKYKLKPLDAAVKLGWTYSKEAHSIISECMLETEES